jgi:hypothetical protein
MLARRRHHLGVFLYLLAGAALSNESLTVTVEGGAQHTFRGFGAAANRGNSAAVARRLYHPDEGGFRFIRLWAHTAGGHLAATGAAGRYGGYVREILKVQPDAIVLLAPCMQTNRNIGNVDGFAKYYCDAIKKARNEGLHIHMTGLCNEMENFGRVRADQIVPLIKAYRKHLDANGLQDVKMIAPESANVDSTMYKFVDNIKADQDALDKLDGWGYHAYNCSITYILREKVFDTGKPIWQTESSTDQKWTIEGGDNSGQIGGSNGVRIVADLNMGTNYWGYFIDAGGGSDGTALVYPDGRPKLQYFYQIHVGRTIDVGARFRYCLADRALPRVEMTWEYGQKPAIVCCAAVNPDGSWGIAVCNGTGIQRDTQISKFYPPTTYDVTVRVEELEGAGDIGFRVTRTNKSVRLEEEAPVTMRDGSVTVTLGSIDLVGLRSDRSVEARRVPAADEKQLARSVRQGNAVRVHVSSRHAYTVRICDMNGRTVRLDSSRRAGCLVPLKGLPAGAYVLDVTTAEGSYREMFSVTY